MSRNPRMHEWAWGDVGRRTVCGLRLTRLRLRHANLAVVTAHDLGDVDAADRCKNCELMRAAIGTSKKREASAP